MKENPREGFVYAGRVRDGSVLKIGHTVQDDPGAYVRRRYGGLLELDALMRVSDARAVEKRLHKYFDIFRVDGKQRELFSGFNISPSVIQAAFVEATLEVQQEIPIATVLRVNNAKKTFYEDD